MVIFRWIVTLMVLLALIVFGSLNSQTVEVHYFFNRTASMPMFLLMGLLILFGAFAAALVGVIDQIKLAFKVRSQARQIQELRQELAAAGRVPEGDTDGAGENDREYD